MNNRDELITIFEDTRTWYEENEALRSAVQTSIVGTKVYKAAEYPQLPAPKGTPAVVRVSRNRSFEAAMRLAGEYPESRIAVHNFASATNPGGGVTRGSRAQEECLCRCSTLYPVLNTPELWNRFYKFHRMRQDMRYTDTCVYSPGIKIVKTDTDKPQRMKQEDWVDVDVITCAAPNLRERPYNTMNPGQGKTVKVSDSELLELHKKRAAHLLCAAAANGAEVVVLGAFGCGAFQNKPEIVAQAYRSVLEEYKDYFRVIEFAVYCTPRDSANYDAFRRILKC